jgi:hypothetical protein
VGSPIPFRWSYNILQDRGALPGWALGAAIGPGTVLVNFLLVRASTASHVPLFNVHAGQSQGS